MKTSDIDVSMGQDLTAKGYKSGAASLFDWLLPKRKTKKHKLKGAGQATIIPDSKTKTSQSISDVLNLLRADKARRVLILSDQAFCAAFRAVSDDIETIWASTDILNDPQKGAHSINAALIQNCDAVIVGGTDVGTQYRYCLRLIHTYAPKTPVHWVAQNWEFCAGTAAIPHEIDDVDALVFNHFEEFFGIKDPLQFRFEIIAEGETKRSYLTLGPNESTNLNLNSLLPDRHGAICIKVFVSHPFLTRGRHYRFRVCGDIFWKDSFTIIHGSHQFFKNPNKVQPFRLIDSVVRNGKVVMTVPNYDLDMGSDDEIKVGVGDNKEILKRSRLRPVEVVQFRQSTPSSKNRGYFAASYAGYGTSFWYAFDQEFSLYQGKTASIAANHLCRVGVENRDDILFTPTERQIVETILDAGFMIHPCCLPITSTNSPLAFGFNFDASNPPFDDYWLRFYDNEGRFLDQIRYHKTFVGPIFLDDIMQNWMHPQKADAVMVLVSPDHLKIGLAPQRLVTTSDMVVRHRITGDQDFTEFQSSWRNLGTSIPTLPHWLHPSIGVMGRTNVIGRVRTKDGFRTAVYVANASGNLKYDMPAKVEVAAVNNAGQRLSYFFSLPAFGSRIVWLDDVLPQLSNHLGASGIATLQVKSADADLTGHVIGLSPNGAVGLQHLWGY